jgi:hypothetical protein
MFAAIITDAKGNPLHVITDPSWHTGDHVCAAFDIEGLGKFRAAGDGYPVTVGNWAGFTVQIRPRSEGLGQCSLTLCEGLPGAGTDEGIGFTYLEHPPKPPIRRLDTPLMPAYTNGEVGPEELAFDRAMAAAIEKAKSF